MIFFPCFRYHTRKCGDRHKYGFHYTIHLYRNGGEISMVRKIRNLWQCPECGMLFKEEKWAKKCEAWCREHHTCHIEITRHAVRPRS